MSFITVESPPCLRARRGSAAHTHTRTHGRAAERDAPHVRVRDDRAQVVDVRRARARVGRRGGALVKVLAVVQEQRAEEALDLVRDGRVRVVAAERRGRGSAPGKGGAEGARAPGGGWYAPEVRADLVPAGREHAARGPAAHVHRLDAAHAELARLHGVDRAERVHGHALLAAAREEAEELVREEGAGEGERRERALLRGDGGGGVRPGEAREARGREEGVERGGARGEEGVFLGGRGRVEGERGDGERVGRGRCGGAHGERAGKTEAEEGGARGESTRERAGCAQHGGEEGQWRCEGDAGRACGVFQDMSLLARGAPDLCPLRPLAARRPTTAISLRRPSRTSWSLSYDRIHKTLISDLARDYKLHLLRATQHHEYDTGTSYTTHSCI